MTKPETKAGLFLLGQIVATPGALRLLAEHNINASSLLDRHARGDWGDLDSSDAQSNSDAIQQHLRSTDLMATSIPKRFASYPKRVSLSQKRPINPDIARAFDALDGDGKEFFQERAGIREHDGGLDQQQAELEALIETISYLCERDI